MCIQECRNVWVVAAAIAGMVPAWSGQPAQTGAGGVPIATVTRGQGGAVAELEGVLEAVRQSTVAAQTSGRVTAVYAKAGDAIRAGQLLATIDDREAQAAGIHSVAQNEAADAALRIAQQQLSRQQELRAQGFVSQAALDATQAQYDSALANKKQAKAASAQTGLTQGYTRVTAPFDGFVNRVDAEVGDLATPAKPLLVVYAPQPLRAVVQVPASRLAAVLQSKNLALQVGDGNGNTNGGQRWLSVGNKTVVPSADPVAQTTELRLQLQPADSQGLLPGQQARLRFERTETNADSSTALQVPRAAVVQRGELTAVYVWTGQVFSLRPVRVGNAVGDAIQVLSGLRSGETVATDPVRAASVRQQ